MTSHSLPLGAPQAISVSLPNWDEVVRSMADQQFCKENLQTNYPRFVQHPILQQLNQAVLERVRVAPNMLCMVFPAQDGMTRLFDLLRNLNGSLPIWTLSFVCDTSSSVNATWASFQAVLFHEDFRTPAEEFWSIFGDGISSRHAEFCMERFGFMKSVSSYSFLETSSTADGVLPLPQWDNDTNAKETLKTSISKWIAPEQPFDRPVTPEDVFLYPKGMCAIGAVARALVPSDSTRSEAVVYGWPYSSTPKCVKGSGYERFTLLGQGTTEQLDQLQASLAEGKQISVLFCELTSNPLLSSLDLRRIRKLADRYQFLVVCDETLGTFVNVDVMPYVDIAVTSLTKIFSGACNVMGGSVVVNPMSPCYQSIHDKISSLYEDHLFPSDALHLVINSSDFPSRVQRCNSNAFTLANLLNTHPSISRVNYPSLVPTSSLYEQFRRPQGGYGFLLSQIFHEPESAVRFYDALDVCKGPSVGTNFTLSIPYSQLSHSKELDWAEEQGLSKHIVRISVGLEEEDVLVERITQALSVV